MTERISCEVLAERVSQLERRCEVKEQKLEKILEFQNRVIGYALAASAIITFISNYLLNK